VANPISGDAGSGPSLGLDVADRAREHAIRLFGVAAIIFGAYAIWLIGGHGDYIPGRDLVLYTAVLAIPVLSFATRARLGGPAAIAWWCFAAGALVWLVADATYIQTTAGGAEAPAWVDWAYVGANVMFYAGVIALARCVLPGYGSSVWLDGLIITCTVVAFGTLFFPQFLENFTGNPADMFVAASGPLIGLLLVSLLIAVVGVMWGAAGPMWWWLLAGASSLWLTDMMWLTELSESTYVNGALLDLGWPAGMLAMGFAAWWPVSRGRALPQLNWAVPLSVTVAAFAIVLHATQVSTPQITVGFAAGAVLFGGVRSAQAFRTVSRRAEAQRQAVSDDLTGLANRRGLDLTLAAEPTAQRALLLVDIDRFKQINDTLGHHAGDEVLLQVSARLLTAVPDDAAIARIGGDEFAVLLGPGSGWDQAVRTAEDLHAAVGSPVTARDIEIQVDISIGISFIPQNGTSLTQLLSSADRAMRRAKNERVGSMVFDQRWESGSGGLMLMQDLRKALDQGEFVCYFQPQLDVLTDEVVAVESLLRWQHPQRGIIPAGQFLPMLEQTALIRPLTDFVIDASLAQLRRWEDQGLHLRVSVNLSATNLMDLGLPLRVAQLLTRHRIPASRLTLEVTETALAGDQERAHVVLGQLHEIGAQLSIDDYGSGYSSLQQVGRLGAQELKLDREFVTGAGQRGDLQSILSATAHLAHGLRLRMVAEGVESASDLDQVRAVGCDLAQGFFISPARSADDLTDWIAIHRAERTLGTSPRDRDHL
jgi:diguanylate cyclase (GGDEF)-like protein